MRYTEDAQKSAEYLRQALALMTRQVAPLHPVSYTVWYEYVAGMNPGLKSELDELLTRKTAIDNAAIEGLYRKYIAEMDEEAAQKITARFQRALASMSESASAAGDRASQFGQSLEQLSEGLGKSAQGGALDVAEVAGLMDSTRGMQDAVSTLKARLEESQREAETLRKEINRAREDALTDGLSGLTNRKGFDKVLAECLASAETKEKGLSLIMADIDHFKKVNDTYGHLFGDKVIRAVSQVIQQNVKGRDTAARYGGEEFVILLPNTPVRGAQALAEAIRSAVESSRIKRLDNNEIVSRITMSFGVAEYAPNESGGDFVGRADKALYASKHEGRNRVTLAEAVAQAA